MIKANGNPCPDKASESKQDYFSDDSLEPQLWEYKGFDDPEIKQIYECAYNGSSDYDCKDCFFRTFFTEHVKQGVIQIQIREA